MDQCWAWNNIQNKNLYAERNGILINTSNIHGMGKACNEMEDLQKQIVMSKNKM